MTESANHPQTSPTQPAAKKSAAKKSASAPVNTAAASAETKAAAAANVAKAKAEHRNVYLPTLPDGYAYTEITATGPDGATFTVSPTIEGKGLLKFSATNLNREQEYDSIDLAAKAGQKAAKAIAERAKRQAEIDAITDTAFDL